MDAPSHDHGHSHHHDHGHVHGHDHGDAHGSRNTLLIALALTLGFAALIGVAALRLLREVVHVLMEGVPPHLQLDAVGHDLHVWTLSSGTIALSAHLEIRRIENWPAILDDARHTLAARHGIRHVTLQPEVPVVQPLRRGSHPPASPP